MDQYVPRSFYKRLGESMEPRKKRDSSAIRDQSVATTLMEAPSRQSVMMRSRSNDYRSSDSPIMKPI